MRVSIVLMDGILMKRNKSILFIIIILIILTSFCACLPSQAKTYDILLSDDQFQLLLSIGEFKLAKRSNDQYSRIFEVLPKDKENFIIFLKNSQYYMDTFELDNNSYYLTLKNRNKLLKGGDKCMWFTAQDQVWIGKYYGGNTYYLTYIPRIQINNDDFFVDLSQAIFSSGETPNDVEVEYGCAVNWEQLKKIYSTHKINEIDYSIEIDCTVYFKEGQSFSPDGKTLLYYNKDNNTLRISEDYYREA